MKLKYFLYGFLAFSFVIGYNLWLIQRDKILYEKYLEPTHQVQFK